MTLNPSDQLFESLSAMVDNEASELEMRRVLKNMDSNPEVLERWRRYHMIGSVMRKEHSLAVANPVLLVSSISNSLNGDGEVGAVTQNSGAEGAPKLLREIVSKTAIAASFAATLVLGFNYLGASRDLTGASAGAVAGDNTGAGQAPTPQFQAVAHAPVGFELPLPEARTVSMGGVSGIGTAGAESKAAGAVYVDDITDYETQEMLNRLLIQHAERASLHGSLGIMPFARVHKMQSEAVK